MNKVKFTLLTAGFVLAMAFTFSCSGDDGKEDGGSSSSTEGGGQVGGSSSSGGRGDGNSITYGNDTYPIVVIGTQTWLAKNLNYAVEGSKCYGEGGEVEIDWDDENKIPITKALSNAEVRANCDEYGRLYDWSKAMEVCPLGWHLPSNYDWEVLLDYAGSPEKAGTKLRAKNGWYRNGNNTDQYGFSALPGGSYLGGRFQGVYSFGAWWSASEGEGNSDYAYSLGIEDSDEYVHWGSLSDKSSGKSNFFSVRCVKDN